MGVGLRWVLPDAVCGITIPKRAISSRISYSIGKDIYIRWLTPTADYMF